MSNPRLVKPLAKRYAKNCLNVGALRRSVASLTKKSLQPFSKIKTLEELILHIGMHKTGSSSIQFTMAKQLKDQDTQYVKLGKKNHSVIISGAFRDPQYSSLGYRLYGIESKDDALKHSSEAKQVLERGMEEARMRRGVVSAESFMSLSQKELQHAHAFFSRYAETVKAVGYVRPPKSLAESFFSWQIVRQATKFPRPAKKYYYESWFEKFEAVFDKNKVVLKKFDKSSLYNGCVVQDLFKLLDLRLEPHQVIITNESFSLPVIQLLYCYRIINPGPDKPNAIMKHMRELSGPRFRIHSKVARETIILEKSQMAWIAERIGASLEEDWEKDDDIAVQSESDLFNLSEETLDWLGARTGQQVSDMRFVPENIGKAVAMLAEIDPDIENIENA